MSTEQNDETTHVGLFFYNDDKTTKFILDYLKQYFDLDMKLGDIANIIKNYCLLKYQLCQLSDQFISYKPDNVLSNDRYLFEKKKPQNEHVTLDSNQGFYKNDETNPKFRMQIKCFAYFLKGGFN